LADITRSIGEKAQALGGRISLPDDRFRAPHVLSLGFPGGMPASLLARLADNNVYAAPRLGRLRISPHVYNDEADVERLVSVLGKALAATA
jgi:selenocysteine lyase/cysteine desulfurase